MPVVDAGVLIAALTERGPRGASGREVVRAGGDVHAPHIVDIEVLSGLRGLVRGGRIELGAAADGIRQLERMPLRRHAHVSYLWSVWRRRENLTPYDAAYVALAERLGLQLITTDARLAGAPDLGCDVRVLTD